MNPIPQIKAKIAKDSVALSLEGWVDMSHHEDCKDEICSIIPKSLLYVSHDNTMAVEGGFNFISTIVKDQVEYHRDDVGWCVLFCLEGQGRLYTKVDDVERVVDLQEGDITLFDDRELHAFDNINGDTWIMVILLKAVGREPPRRLNELGIKKIMKMPKILK